MSKTKSTDSKYPTDQIGDTLSKKPTHEKLRDNVLWFYKHREKKQGEFVRRLEGRIMQIVEVAVQDKNVQKNTKELIRNQLRSDVSDYYTTWARNFQDWLYRVDMHTADILCNYELEKFEDFGDEDSLL